MKTQLNEGFSDFERENRELIVKVKHNISSHPGVEDYLGQSRIDGERLYRLKPQYFYGDEPLTSQLGVKDIELIQPHTIEDYLPITNKTV